SALGGTPAQVLVGKDGRIFVSLRDRAEVLVLEVLARDGSVRKVSAMATPAEPIGLAFTPDDATLLVSSGWSHKLTAFSAKTGARAFAADLPREPRAIVVSDDGAKAFVSHTIGSKLSVVALTKATHDVRVVDLDERTEVL